MIFRESSPKSDVLNEGQDSVGDEFVEPQSLVTKTARVMSLQDPNQKMSKSQPDGCLFMDDSPEEVERKIMSAVTDSEKEVRYDVQSKAGLSNLLGIYASLSNKEIAEIESEFKNKNYAKFKKSLAKIITKHFAPFRRKKDKLLANQNKLIKTAQRGNKIANKIAGEKILKVEKRLGLML